MYIIRVGAVLLSLGLLMGLLICNEGCSHSDRPALGLVRGRVTFDGSPLAGAFVVFTPQAGGRQSSGRTNQDGVYELTYLRDIKGAKAGTHKVIIATATEQSAERLPARYNSDTTLQAEVKPGNNELNFDLTSH